MPIALRIVALPGLVAALGLGAGCGSTKMGISHSPEADTASPTTSPSPTAPVDSDTASSPAPVWWVVDGVLAVAAGEVDLESTSFTVTLTSRDATPICSTARSVASAEVLDGALDELHGLWSVVLTEGEGCTEPVPAVFEVGIGAYDPQLDPALAPSGLDGAALFGLYVRTDGGPLYVFGIAGTADQLAGTVPEAPPLPDGFYTLDGLYVLPL